MKYDRCKIILGKYLVQIMQKEPDKDGGHKVKGEIA